jgi:predicted nucleotidyltransferase
MRIKSSDWIVGYPALTIRKLMREGRGGSWGLSLVEDVLEVSSRTAKRVIRDLEKEGFIERDDFLKNKQYWRTTIKGNALSMASAAKPISRASAEKKLSEFLDRVRKVKQDDYFLFKVERIIVFGSYLGSEDLLSDIDLAIKLVRKTKDDEEFKRLSSLRIDEAYEKGRTFRNTLDYIFFPSMEVTRYLKSRSRVIHIHDEKDPILDQTQTCVIYEDSE